MPPCSKAVIAGRFINPTWPASTATTPIGTRACRPVRSPAQAPLRYAPGSLQPRPITCISSPDRMAPGATSFRRTSRPIARPPPDTAVGSRSKSKKQQLEEFLRERQPATIGEEQWGELVALLTPISENYLRELLNATGLEVAQPFRGARISSFEELEASLLDMEKEYARAVAAGDHTRTRACCRAVIQAKDLARQISRNPKVDQEKRKQ